MWTQLSYHQNWLKRCSAFPQPWKNIAAAKAQSTARGTLIARTANTATPGSRSRTAASQSPWMAKISAPIGKLRRNRSSGSRSTGCQSRRKTLAHARFAPATHPDSWGSTSGC